MSSAKRPFQQTEGWMVNQFSGSIIVPAFQYDENSSYLWNIPVIFVGHTWQIWIWSQRYKLYLCINMISPNGEFNEWNFNTPPLGSLKSCSFWYLFWSWATITFVIYEHTVYPKKYAHGFVVLCFVVVMQSFIINSHEVFIHIHQGCFAGTGAIVRLPQCQWSKPDGYGKISQCITTTKHSKAKTVCIFLGIYCSIQHCFENYENRKAEFGFCNPSCGACLILLDDVQTVLEWLPSNCSMKT